MTWEAWVTLIVVLLIVAALARELAGTDVILLGGLTLLMTLRLFSDKFPSAAQAAAGFGNEGPITVGVLYVVVAGLVRTGAVTLLAQPLLGRPRSVRSAQTRLVLPVALMSGFLNNTPIVAMFIPVVRDWCKKTGISASKLLIPLSYASIFGGVCTLIGTSTNLVVNGLLKADPQLNRPQGLGMFDITWIGLPCLLAGLAYLIVLGKHLLPDRRPPVSAGDDPRQYSVEMLVDPEGPLVGQTVERAGLRHLPGLYLVEIDREDQLLAAVGPEEKLRANDRLVFVGIVDSVVDLRKIRGLKPVTDQVTKLDAPLTRRCLVEAVVSYTCPLVGRTIRDGRFRSRYNAAVIAVARHGQRIHRKIGDIVLHAGDTLLLETHPGFVTRQRDSKDFFLVSSIEDSAPVRHHLAGAALGILAGLVVSVALGWLSMLNAALLAGGAMVLTRCCSGSEARRSVDWQVLLAIGAALGIGQAVESTGAARAVAGQMISLAHANPWIILAMVYLVTALFTEVMTNNTAAVLVFPLAKAAALSAGVDPLPFIFTVMVAASASFATPIGYQTNMMVYGPGGYRFSDFLRIGLPLNGIMMAVSVILIPLIWPFQPAIG